MTILALAQAVFSTDVAQTAEISLAVRQVTHGPRHHFFGYIGHVQNIPWSGDGRWILALRTEFQDRMPGPTDPAEIVLLDTRQNFAERVVERTHAWNPQQGTMLYWNPKAAANEFFFNDRDARTGKVFGVRCRVEEMGESRRVREYRFNDTPIGNSGVAQRGGSFLAINYARMARLRPVTGYKEATDWTVGVDHPRDDGIFKVDVETGRKELLVSFAALAEVLKKLTPNAAIPPLFINHTLWNREDDRIFFFARAGWNGEQVARIDQPFVMRSDGSHLTPLKQHIGGHPDWDFGHRLIGRADKRQILFDADRQLVIGTLGTPKILPKPEGDVALSPDGRLFVNGYREGKATQNQYVIYRREDGEFVRSQGFEFGQWGSGDLRLDPAPCWNRASNQLLVPGLDPKDGTRQMFLIDVR